MMNQWSLGIIKPNRNKTVFRTLKAERKVFFLRMHFNDTSINNCFCNNQILHFLSCYRYNINYFTPKCNYIIFNFMENESFHKILWKGHSTRREKNKIKRLWIINIIIPVYILLRISNKGQLRRTKYKSLLMIWVYKLTYNTIIYWFTDGNYSVSTELNSYNAQSEFNRRHK